MGKRGGRCVYFSCSCRTLAGMTLTMFLSDALKQGTIMQTIKKFEYKQGVARQEELFKKLRKKGLTDKDIKTHLGALLRSGDVYMPRETWYRRTAYKPHRRKRK